MVVWTFFGIALWNWNENWPFPVLWPLLSFPNLFAYWVQHFHSIIFEDLKYSAGILSPPLALFVVMLHKAHLTSHSRMSGSSWVTIPSWLPGSLRQLGVNSWSLLFLMLFNWNSQLWVFWVICLRVLVSCWRRQWHSIPVLLPEKSHGRRSLVGCSPWDHKESDTTEWLHFHFSLSYIGEGSGNPLQCSCLGNPRDGGAWWAAVYGVVQSLKRLSSSSISELPMRQLPEELQILLLYLGTSSI